MTEKPRGPRSEKSSTSAMAPRPKQRQRNAGSSAFNRDIALAVARRARKSPSKD